MRFVVKAIHPELGVLETSAIVSSYGDACIENSCLMFRLQANFRDSVISRLKIVIEKFFIGKDGKAVVLTTEESRV